MADSIEKMVSDLCAAVSRRNPDELLHFFTDDAVYDNVPMGAVKGKEAIRKALDSYLRPTKSAEFRVLRSARSANVVFNERLDVFEMGGKRIELPVVGIFEITGDKISLWRDYFDLATWRRQMQ